MTPDSEKFARLGRPRRIWTVGAIHGETARLAALHDHIGASFAPGDRIVYLGNFVGRVPDAQGTINELLTFRREVLSVPGALASDVVYLRGAQEEMWQKLLQLQFAPNPHDVLRWMLAQGVEATLQSYGGTAREGLAATRDGAVTLTRWTNRLRDQMRTSPGHVQFFSALRRAAFTEPDNGVLLVSAGLDPARPLAAQGDAFWWATQAFSQIKAPYETFRRIVRGYDPQGGGVSVGEVTLTLDAGAGRGGRLACAVVSLSGEIEELLEA